MVRRKVMTAALPPHPIEATEAFKVYITRPGVSDPRSLQRSLTRFFREMAPVSMKAVDVIHINQALERLSVQGNEASYTDKLFRAASAFFSWCRELGYIDSNPFKATSAPKSEKLFVPTLIPKEDITALHDHIIGRGIVEEIILWGAFRMGARISEPCMADMSAVVWENRSFDEFIVNPRIKLGTKTNPRIARMPRFTIPAYAKLIEARGADLAAPLLYLKGCPLYVRDKEGKMVENLDARTLVARSWFEARQKEALGEYKWTPKEMRSTFISMETMDDPSKIVAIAMQCGNSVKVIQTNYLNYFNMPEFGSGEA